MEHAGQGDGVSAWMRALLVGLACAGFVPTAVRRAAAGSPEMLFGLALPALLPMLLHRLRRRRRAAPFCRVVPDPLTADLTPIANAIQLTWTEARVRQSRASVDIAPLIDRNGSISPYRVVLRPERHAKRLTIDAEMHQRPPNAVPSVQVHLPPSTQMIDNADFTVDSPDGIRLTAIPDDNGRRIHLRHDADTALRRLARLDHPMSAALATAVLIYNLGRHGPYAPLMPRLGLLMFCAALMGRPVRLGRRYVP